jgi:hypothetical protein
VDIHARLSVATLSLEIRRQRNGQEEQPLGLALLAAVHVLVYGNLPPFEVHVDGPAGHALERLLHHAHGLLHLGHAHQVAVEVVTVLAERHLELDPVVRPVRLHPAKVEGHAGGAQERARDSPRDGVLRGERPHADHAIHEDAVAGDEGVDLVQHLPRLREGLAHLDAEGVGKIGLDPAHPAVGDGQARPRDVLHELPQELARLDHVEEHGHGAHLHGGGTHAGEMVADPRDLAHDHANVLAPLRDLDAEELFHRGGVGEVVDEGRDVVQPVRVGDGIVVRARLAVLLEGAVEIADLHLGLDHRLAVELRKDADDPVHGRMRRTHVDVEVLAARSRPGSLSQKQLARGSLWHG